MRQEKKFPWGEIKDSKSGYRVTIKPEDGFPWLKEDQVLPATRVTLDNGQQVLIASAIGKHSRIKAVAGAIPPDESDKLNSHFYKAVAERVKGRGISAKAQYTGADVNYARSRSARVFFVDTNDIENQRVVVKVAACRVADKDAVFNVINAGSEQKKKK